MSERSSKPSASPSSAGPLTPSSAAYRITHVLNAVCLAHGLERFPIKVGELALEAANIFGWADPITEVRAEQIDNFEGALIPDESRSKWLLLYNNALRSEGRIRFTQAHELGHYILHRTQKSACRCSDSDMIDLEPDDQNLESQADAFASTLLMPLDDFRVQMGDASSFDALAKCADRYGVSLTAATLRWLGYTKDCALLVVHREGFMLWSVASEAARRMGAFFKTRSGSPIPIPQGSLAINGSIASDEVGQKIDARIWFPHATAGTLVREMKVSADYYDFLMTLLVLPAGERVWAPKGSKWR